MQTTRQILQDAVEAKSAVARLKTDEKNELLRRMASALEKNDIRILKANALDVEQAKGHISDVMIDRLSLTEKRIHDMADGIRSVADLPDPVGEITYAIDKPNGLHIERRSVPMGVIAVIYESRPNVTSDAAALCLKSGSACVLRCGKEAHRSAEAIVQALRTALAEMGLPEAAVSLVEDITRNSSMELMKAVGYVDLLVPRGGAGLIRACVENAIVPCIETGTGICHVFVDETADFEMALNIVENAKTSRPSVCNAEEVLLVHQTVAPKWLPMLYQRLVLQRKEAGSIPVELILDPQAMTFIPGIAADESSFDTEFLDYKLAVKVVSGLDEAIRHISLHSTHHSDCIVTGTQSHAERFVQEVDSAAVYVNASTRFTDGGEFGLGCEMGISTQKLHARGPMGLRELCTTKYVILGNGQIRT